LCQEPCAAREKPGTCGARNHTALLFVGGVMNVLWIAAIAILVLAEKVIPAGRYC
jgi:predicted metal-binding membrane protein